MQGREERESIRGEAGARARRNGFGTRTKTSKTKETEMAVLGCTWFFLGFTLATLLAAGAGAARKLTWLGRALGLLAVFLGVRYFVIPAWMPEGELAYKTKAVFEIMFLHSLAVSASAGITAGTQLKRGGGLGDLLVRLALVGGLYLAFWDVVSVWPLLGQAWLWLYLLAVVALGGWLGSVWVMKNIVGLAVESASGNESGKKIAARGGLSCLGMLLMAVLGIVSSFYFVFCILSEEDRTAANREIGNVVATLREAMSEKMPLVEKQTAKLLAVWEKALEADRKMMERGGGRTADARSRREVAHSLGELRELLLPVDSRAILSAVEKLDRDIASEKKGLAAARERRLFHPAGAEKWEKRIRAREEKLSELEKARADAAAKVLADLDAIGIHLEGETAERCLFTVNTGDLVDNAIVAKNISILVENLKRLMAETGDAESAKRYFGTYLVMIDVQAECYRRYIAKSESGVWRKGVEGIRRDADGARARNALEAGKDGYAEAEREGFRRNVALNERTIAAADAYLEVLRQHEEIVKGKLAEGERLHTLALNSYETVSIASGLLEQVNANQTAFDAMLELTLPSIAAYDDAGMQEEFDAITRKLQGGAE